jgi:hypothetical protein
MTTNAARGIFAVDELSGTRHSSAGTSRVCSPVPACLKEWEWTFRTKRRPEIDRIPAVVG